MPHSVTSLWFLNLALADLLCCLTLPLLMVPLVQDDRWTFGSLSCPILKGLLYVMMYCSVLQLVLISVDRYLLVTKPVWCQNKRRPRAAAWMCVLVWCFAIIGSIPQFIVYQEVPVASEKMECKTAFPSSQHQWFFYSFRFVLGFVLPFLVIAVCHWKVYMRAESGLSRGNRSKRTLKIIVAVIVSFFLCWIPLHIVDFLFISLSSSRTSDAYPRVLFAHAMAVCLAYANSCLNPLLYVCLGRDFKNRVNRSMRSFLNFATEDPQSRMSVNDVSKSTSTTKEMTKI